MLSQILLLALVVLAVVVCMTYVYKDIDKGDGEEKGNDAGNDGEPGNDGEHADNVGDMAVLGGGAPRILKRQSARARSPCRRVVL
jgi:hypothetical protein